MSVARKHHRLSRAGLAATAMAVLGGTFAIGLAGPASAATTDLTGVVLDEIESSAPGGGPDWIELFNDNDFSVDLADGYLSDSGDDHVFPLFGTIPAFGYKAFDVGDSNFAGDFGLGDADSARLFQGGGPGVGVLEDSFTWASPAFTTYGRNWAVDTTPHDGLGDW